MSKELKAAEEMIEVINSLVKKGYSDDDIRRYYRMMGELCAGAGTVNDTSKDSQEAINELIDIVETLNNRIESLETVIKTKSGEGGRLFGSITAKDITDAVKEQHNISLDKKKLVMDGPIKNVGEFCIEAKIYTEVTAKIKVIVETK